MVKERVNAIALPTVEDIRRDSNLFLEGTRTGEFQELTQAAMKRGFQTRDAEMDLARLVEELNKTQPKFGGSQWINPLHTLPT